MSIFSKKEPASSKFRGTGQVPPTRIGQQLLGGGSPTFGMGSAGVTPKRRAVTFPCESPQHSEESVGTALDSPFCLLSWQGRQCRVKIKVQKNKIKFREILCYYSAHSCVIFVKIVDLALRVSLTPISTQKSVFLDPVPWWLGYFCAQAHCFANVFLAKLNEFALSFHPSSHAFC